MTNFEFYKEDLCRLGINFALTSKGMRGCHQTDCWDCLFSRHVRKSNNPCDKFKMMWFCEEYEEKHELNEKVLIGLLTGRGLDALGEIYKCSPKKCDSCIFSVKNDDYRTSRDKKSAMIKELFEKGGDEI